MFFFFGEGAKKLVRMSTKINISRFFRRYFRSSPPKVGKIAQRPEFSFKLITEVMILPVGGALSIDSSFGADHRPNILNHKIYYLSLIFSSHF